MQRIGFLFFFFTVIPIFPLCPLPPSSPPLPQTVPHHCSCRWVMCIGSLATSFPILYFTSPWLFCNYLIVLLKNTLFIYFQREGKREREGNINVWLPFTCPPPPTGDLAWNPGMCPDQELNWRAFDSKSGTQSTVPHQPGPECTSYSPHLFTHSPTCPSHLTLMKTFSVSMIMSLFYLFAQFVFKIQLLIDMYLLSFYCSQF